MQVQPRCDWPNRFLSDCPEPPLPVTSPSSLASGSSLRFIQPCSGVAEVNNLLFFEPPQICGPLPLGCAVQCLVPPLSVSLGTFLSLQQMPAPGTEPSLWQIGSTCLLTEACTHLGTVYRGLCLPRCLLFTEVCLKLSIAPAR